MPDELERPQPMHPRLRRRVERFAATIALVTVVVMTMAVIAARAERQRQLHAMLAAIAAAGFPVDPGEFDAAYNAGKPEPNAADGYLEALVYFETGDADAALERALEAAAIARCRYPIRLESGTGFPFELSTLRDLGRIIGERIEETLAAGEHEEARLYLEARFALAESLNEAPLLIMQMMRIALLGEALDALAAVLVTDALDADGMREFDARLAVITLQPALVDALAAERASSLARTRSNAAALTPPSRLIAVVTGSHDGLARGLLIGYDEAIAAAEAEPRYRGAELDRLAAIPSMLDRFERISAGAVLPSALHTISSATEVQGRLAAARGAIVLERYRLAEGALPESTLDLAQRGMTLPSDPLGNAPIRYALDDRGYRAWSVGMNGLDEGGAPGSDDIVFAVEKLQ